MGICIFCQKNSDSSKSVEHIIPESLGNKDIILPKGVVCDTCNQYFATKVEKPLLESTYFQNVRFRNNILSKKGRSTPGKALIPHPKGGWVDLYNDKHGFSLNIENPDIINIIRENKVNKMIVEVAEEPIKNNYIMSRFLAKTALESLAFIGLGDKKWLEEVRNMKELAPLRRYARYGEGKQWIYHQRRIYGEEVRFTDPIRHPEPYEVLHEMDFLYIDPGIYYYVLVIMGVEFVINCGASELDLFTDWLEKNNQISPIRRGSEKMIKRVL